MPPNSLSLKQRLAALSIAPSAPSSPRGSDVGPGSPISPRRKAFFTPPWTKRQGDLQVSAEHEARELVQDTMSKLIFQAGVDYETRPMVVVNASALPDPRVVNYDLLLSRILSYLNLYVESDYTVVFLAAGSNHSPGWNWVWKAYRSLSRKYRKNLKRLYIVHSTFFTKMLFSLAGAIISPKFFRKITYLDTLSELAYHVPLTQIDIPPAVYQENLKHEKQINLPTPSPSSTFGVPLEDIMGYEGEKGSIPRPVKDAIQFLRDSPSAMLEEGLFRRSAPSAMLRAAQDAYDRGNFVSLETFGDPHLAAVLLKKYLRDLPTPVFPETMYPIIRRCPMPTSDPGDMGCVMYVREMLLTELPPCTYILLSHVLHLMHEVSLRSASNRMDAHNLAIVLSPNLVKGTNPARDVMMCAVPGGPALFDAFPNSPPPPSNKAALAESKTTLGVVIKLCIQRYYEVFDEVLDRTEAVFPSGVGYNERERDSTPGESPSRNASADPSDDERGVQEEEHELSLSSRPRLQQHHRRQSSGVHTNPDDEEDIDDAMLVMPIGPSHGHGHNNTTNGAASGQSNGHGHGSGNGATPSSVAWGATNGITNIGTSTYKPRHRSQTSGSSNASRGVGVRSVNTDYGPPSSFPSSTSSYATYSKAKARSTISVEKGGTIGPGRKGSISVGRGTTRKSTGAGVAAIGITAEGFFAAPGSVPPVPPLPGAVARNGAGDSQH